VGEHPLAWIILVGKLDLDLSGHEVDENLIRTTRIIGILIIQITG
jgi:hypothetical protein